LADRIIYTNQYQLRNQLALVDNVGQIVGVLDKDEVEVEDDDSVSLHENQKSPVVVEAIEPKDEKVGCINYSESCRGTFNINLQNLTYSYLFRMESV